MRIEAIARDRVNHYINNILPDGSKAQVVCHPRLMQLLMREQNDFEPYR